MSETAFREADVYVQGRLAGLLSETDDGYCFQYDGDFLKNNPEPVSILLPVIEEPYTAKVLFPFFDGLLPEGVLLDSVRKRWGIPERDRFGVLLKACKDPIGKVQITEHGEKL